MRSLPRGAAPPGFHRLVRTSRRPRSAKRARGRAQNSVTAAEQSRPGARGGAGPRGARPHDRPSLRAASQSRRRAIGWTHAPACSLDLLDWTPGRRTWPRHDDDRSGIVRPCVSNEVQRRVHAGGHVSESARTQPRAQSVVVGSYDAGGHGVSACSCVGQGCETSFCRGRFASVGGVTFTAKSVRALVGDKNAGESGWAPTR